MNKTLRTPLIAGNWKMNNTPAQTTAFLRQLLPLLQNPPCSVAVCPPHVSLTAAAAALQGSGIALGAQACHFAAAGAYTGDTSPLMLAAIGCEYVLVGHSERRAYHSETDEDVNQRVKAALAAGIAPVICVGESLAQRQNGETENVLKTQTGAALLGLCEEDIARCVIAYEPIWAIGTGQTATPQKAGEACAFIRSVVRVLFGNKAETLQILYGGSMNAENAASLLAQSDIDGGLIGGASLKAEDFAAIVAATKQ